MWFWIGERYLRLFRKICKIALLRGENFFLQIGHIGCQNIRNFILISRRYFFCLYAHVGFITALTTKLTLEELGVIILLAVNAFKSLK
jgi:hypothetical protein